jgi:long-chain acyl-CoA synthetase
MLPITRIFELLPNYRDEFAREDMVAAKENGVWVTYSTDKFIALTDSLSKGLIASGTVKGDNIAIISANRPEWNICDFAIMQTGAVPVPMYPTLSENDMRFILEDAQIKIAFVSDKTINDKLERLKTESFPDLKIYTFEKVKAAHNWHELVNEGEKNAEISLDDRRKLIKPDDLLTLIYTSGTTGTPKGVMLTHNNLICVPVQVSVLAATSARVSVVVFVSWTIAPSRSCLARRAAPFANVSARLVM